MKAKLRDRFESHFRCFEDNDLVLEYCEDQLLQAAGMSSAEVELVAIADYPLFKGLTPEELGSVGEILQRRTYGQGQVVVEAGEEPSHLYLVAQGRASVLLAGATGARKRLATFSAGMTFGEMAFVDRAPRSATVVADTELVCDSLDIECFEALELRAPNVKIKLLENLSLELSSKLRKTNRELGLFI
jgi:glutaminase